MEEELSLEIRNKNILHWNCRDFSKLPHELREGKEVKEIYLKWNNLKYLSPCLHDEQPRWIGELKSLTNLYLQNNQLQALPEEFGDLLQLNILDVAKNKIKFIPRRIGELLGLTHFLAADNELRCLPKEFKMLKSLEKLDLCSNDFTSLPDSVLECQALQELLLDNNKLSSLPDNIVYLPHLTTLSVCGNNILYLPFQPFSSNPDLCFENNPNLSYMSIWLAKQIAAGSTNKLNQESSWNLKGAQGCFCAMQCPNYLEKRALFVRDEATRHEIPLILPPSLKPLSGPSCQPTVPPLQELALRKAYIMATYHKIEMTNFEKGEGIILATKRTDMNFCYYLSLPWFLQKQLIIGPVTLCYNQSCQKPIFEHGVIWVILKKCNMVTDSDPQIFHVLLIVVFCSNTCREHYAQWERSSSKAIKLESLKVNWYHKN